MNRCRISLAILISLVVLCASALFVLRWQSGKLTERTEAIAQAVEGGNTEQALAGYDKLMEEWEHFHDITGVFVDGTKLDPIRQLLAGLRPLIEAEHPEVLSELERIRELAQDVFTEELPDLWHIL